ncbi:hypothetical protein QBZ16_003204 [Prototheca wickerhamii]|uniref:BFN domain-containing protein n=1 Tax=Prototheca wickerhamii TaxID=3111 RepID=A0AAD9IH24_PROWI|nr:hypothetical protein QBZ16_003204 [Prototheca wickerhamii]
MESHYYRASLQLVQIADVPGSSTGHLLLMREGPRGIVDVERGLVLSVAGDTLAGIASLMQGRSADRPLSLDLLWSVLERGRELSRRDWRLQRVAIVALRGDAYIGRAFFGDASGQTAWDCDCRPSDGCWLSLKGRCPIYVHRRVWEDNASPLKELARQENPVTGAGAAGKAPESAAPAAAPAAPAEDPSPAAQLTSFKPSDPEVLKRLKMEMRVALKDEDYATAKRLRDHPFMRLHTQMVDAEKTGDLMTAQKLRDELSFRVAAYEQTGIVMDEEYGAEDEDFLGGGDDQA